MGSLWMLLAGAAFALMSVLVKEASGQFSSHELVFWRSAVSLVLLYAFLRLPVAASATRSLRGGHLGMHLRRGMVGFGALATFFYALGQLPMSVAVTLNYTSPLFLALIMPWWLRERSRPAQYVAVAVGFVGVAMLLRPWEGQGDLTAGVVGLSSGFLAALAYGHVRQLGKLDEPEWRTVFWFSAVCVAGAALFSTATGWHSPAPDSVGLLLAIGLFAVLGQLAMTRAYRRGETLAVASLAYSTVVFGSLLDVIIWNQELPPIAWAGIATTVAAGVWAARLNAQEPL